MKRKKSIIIGIFLLLSTITIYFLFFNPFISISLNGKQQINQEVNTQYKEKGVTIKGTKNKYKISGTVDTTKIGKYTLTYKITFLKTTKKITRIINVIDKTPPTITLNEGDIYLFQNTKYIEPGYTVKDNYDQNISVKTSGTIDENTPGEYTLTYKAIDSSKNETIVTRKITIQKQEIKNENGITYINGILLVNKKYSLPSTYNPGADNTAYNALLELQKAAKTNNYNIPLISGFRSYQRQNTLYNNYVAQDGVIKADTYSARPGHSEHQSGLAFDVGKIDDNYGNTPAGIWLKENAHKYGFIIRYLKGKEHITGYKYEPWHIRYVGTHHATSIYNRQITLEEYLGVS